MPSKNGFGNSRTPLTRKAQYGVDQKNPIMKKKKPHLKNTLLGKGLDVVSRVPNFVAGAASDTANQLLFKGKNKKIKKFANKQLNKAYGNKGEEMDYTSR
jgi:hypothetical protein